MSNIVTLPIINTEQTNFLQQITSILGAPRNILASDEEIHYAWQNLPRELKMVPIELRDELLVRMCVAVSTGLFDGAINYIWNASIRNLRIKVKDFGYNVVANILTAEFDENKLLNLKDSELLNLCLKLNLISEEGFYFLDQCRDMRNNFSAAHPSIGFIDDRELTTYISRCCKYALSSVVNLKGVDINAFTKAIKGELFTEIQLEAWIKKLNETHEAQREILFLMTYGIYCDPNSTQQARINSLTICSQFIETFTAQIIAELVNKHYDYQSKGDDKRYKASLHFFEKVNLINKLNNNEQHRIFLNACKNLENAHLGYDNFYNEPPFAERLYELSLNNEIPETIKEIYVTIILMAYIGNRYGISRMAEDYYVSMIKNFTAKEIKILLELQEKKSIFSSRINSIMNCKKRYIDAINLVNQESISPSLKVKYAKLLLS